MKIYISYENDDFKATIPFQKIIDLFELTDDQIEAVKRLVLETARTT
jgi:hypothetical protein